MSAIEWIAVIATVLLGIYLVVFLLIPEKTS